ncbi:MAG TPA: sulfurtransferase [Gammaproteobacteria bacterium]|nr:sulfurtransferase [Gammaproteobacteria bacterium]
MQHDARPGAVIEAEALSERLGDPAVAIVDCRFDLADPGAGFAAYREAHIPGACYANLDKDLARAPGTHDGRHPLPISEDLAARLGAWGISNESFVVAYDEGSGAFAARLWWLLRWLGHERAAVLNGGFTRWRSLGLPAERRVGERARMHYAPRAVHEDWVVDAGEAARLAQGKGLLVDARAPARFRGEREPIDPVAGHVPGAVNRPFTENLAADGRLRSAAELRADFQRLLGGRKPAELAAMCGSGVTACHLLWAMEAAGVGMGRLYAGSWSEWIRDPGRPVATGA